MQEIVAAKFFVPFRRYEEWDLCLFELESFIGELLSMNVMAILAALLNFARRSLCVIQIIGLCCLHDSAGTLNICFSPIRSVLRSLRFEETTSLPEIALDLL